MKLHANRFKHALRTGQPQIGLWQGLANAYSAEVCAGIGYDWLLIDGEHAPNTLPTILSQLQALAPYPVAPVVRPSWNDPVQLKTLLDIGAQNFLIPMIQSADEARAAVRAVRYPPEGERGVGNALARAARWGSVTDYLTRANDEICMLCQVETVKGLENLDAILSVDGVDGVFIGPADLAASFGHLGNANHPDVIKAIDDALVRIRASGKAAGILQTNTTMAQKCLDLGATFVAVGVDIGLMRQAATDLLGKFRPDIKPDAVNAGGGY